MEDASVMTSSAQSPLDEDATASPVPTTPMTSDDAKSPPPVSAHSIVRLIQCSHCSRPLRAPLRLPCGNTLCRSCLPPLRQRTGITYPGNEGREQGFTCYWEGDNKCFGEHCLGDCGADVLLTRVVDVFDEVLGDSGTDSDLIDKDKGGFRVSWEGSQGKQRRIAKSANLGWDLLGGIYDSVKQAGFDYDASEVNYEATSGEESYGHVEQESTSFERLKQALRSELDCHICYSLILDPLTTPCGHTFCRGCVAMLLDHSDLCPICRRKLSMSSSTVNSEPVNKRISDLMEIFFPEQVASQRETLAKDEAGPDGERVLPLFVNSLSFPSMPTFLHVFELRYRLMMQRVMESTDRKFGMVMHNHSGRVQEELGRSQFMQYGTVLMIERFELLPDGRSLVFATGVSRFKVIESNIVDGYHVGKIRRVDDISIPEEERLESLETSANVDLSPPAEVTPAEKPLESMSTQQLFQLGLDFVSKRRCQGARWLHPRVLLAYGDVPTDPARFSWWLASIMPVSEQEKYALLSTTSVRDRLKITAKWIKKLESPEWSTPQSISSVL